MTKSELKKILKPLIEETVRETVKKMLLEQNGLLATVIRESINGTLTSQLLTEGTAAPAAPDPAEEQERRYKQKKEMENSSRKVLEESKKKMMSKIGPDAYGGVNLFEGTTPLNNSGKPTSPSDHGGGPLRDLDANDSGVDISKLFPGG